MKNTIFQFSRIALMLSVALLFSCNGDDGAPGPKGPNGEDGTTGSVGADGAKGPTGINGVIGENAPGYDDLVALGNFTVIITGQRLVDGTNFSREIDFKFSPINIAYNSADLNINTGIRLLTFFKFEATPEDIFNEGSYITGDIRINSDGTIDLTSLDIKSYVVNPDGSYFIIDALENSFLANTISEFSFDPADGLTKFKFNMTIPAINNTTGNILTISGSANMLLYEQIN